MTVVQTPSQLGGGHAQRRDAGPGRRAEGLDPGTGARDRAEAEHGRERGPPFGQNGLRPLSDEVGDGSPQRERKQAEPMQRHGSRRCVDQAPVQLSEAGHVGPARAAGRQRGRPAGRDGYPRARCEHDAASTQAGAHTEIESFVGTGECGIRAQGVTDLTPNEEASHIGAEGIVGAVVLSLVEFPCGEFDRAPERGHADAQGDDLTVVVRGDEFGSDDGRGGRALQRAAQTLQRPRMRRRVLREQPDRRSFGDTRSRQFHGFREGRGGARLDDPLDGARHRLALAHGRRIAADDEGHGGCGRGLGAEGFESAEELRSGRGSSARDDDGVNSGWHDVVSLCARQSTWAYPTRRAREAMRPHRPRFGSGRFSSRGA